MPSIEQLRALLEATPDDPFVPYAMAQEHAKLSRFADAVEWYDRCLAMDPGCCYAYYHKARALLELGRRNEALVCIATGKTSALAAKDGHAHAELSALEEETL